MARDTYDTIIIGAGPAGAAAAVYAARKKLRTLLVTEEFGGQSIVSSKIENWIGDASITGEELAKRLEQHVRGQKDIKIKAAEKVVKINETPDCTFEVKTDKDGTYHSKTLIVASGGRKNTLRSLEKKSLAAKAWLTVPPVTPPSLKARTWRW